MEDSKTDVEGYFTGSYIAGFGIFSESPFIDFAKGREIYRIWIDTDWEVKGFRAKEGLTQEQNELLMLNELNNQTVITFKIDSELNIGINLSDSEVFLRGKPKDKNVMEPWRITQTTPESRTILIHTV